MRVRVLMDFRGEEEEEEEEEAATPEQRETS